MKRQKQPGTQSDDERPQEPQQSTLYADYMRSLHWSVERVGSANIFFKTFPFRQGLAKIHRPQTLPDPERLHPLFRKYSVRTLVIEPTASQPEKALSLWVQKMSAFVKINTTPFLPTKTIRVDLTSEEGSIFGSLSEAKRRAVRRAGKLGVTVEESDNMRELIGIKNASAGLFGFITTTGMYPLWEHFSPKHASILLARDNKRRIIGGVLLLHWEGVSYYWIAGSVRYGKKLYAPTLLAWEAIKLSKKKHSEIFDFVGVWDERIPTQNTEWKGFTKFKEGFGGKELYYPLVPRP